MQASSFIQNNQPFSCIHCNYDVREHPSSSRDHCNRCLYSLHVDIHPGDRANDCKGILEPIGLLIKNGQVKIVYECQKCHERLNNVIAPDDDKQTVISLASKVW